MCGVLKLSRTFQNLACIHSRSVWNRGWRFHVKNYIRREVYLRETFLLSFSVMFSIKIFFVASWHILWQIVRPWLTLQQEAKECSEAACIKPLFVVRWKCGCGLLWPVLGRGPERHVFTLNRHHLCLNIWSPCSHRKVLSFPLETFSFLCLFHK